MTGEQPVMVRPPLWGLKTVLTAAIVGPLVMALTMIGLMIAYSVGITHLAEPRIWPNVVGMSQVVLFACFVIISPHVLFFGLIGYGVYLLRHRVNTKAVWFACQNLLLIYAGGCLTFVHNHDPRAQLMQRIGIAVALLAGTLAVWLVTRRWHTPAPARQ